MHLTSVKTFFAITLLLILSYVPVALDMLEVYDIRYSGYSIFVNHVFNPLIYYVCNATFRQDVIEVVAKVKCRG